MLDSYDKFECQDDRERMAASPSIWEDEPTPWSSFKVDYSLSVDENYLGFATAMVQSGHVLPILYAAESRRYEERETDPRRLSSWVADWRRPPLYEFNEKLPRFSGSVIGNRFLKIQCRKCYRFEGDPSTDEMAQEVCPARTPREDDLVCVSDTEVGENRFVFRPDWRCQGAYTLVCKVDDAMWRHWDPHKLSKLASDNETTTLLLA